ncbi:MAG TPA: hypothetical protein VL463_13890 [Kofleriaceae bacterium]|jgi:hypothetical protein|nr:hypothetical protein [Kofleriaceae bacterium]
MRLVIVLVFAAACSGTNGPPPPTATPPAAPAQNDPAFTVHGIRHWSLIPNALTKGDPTMTIDVAAPAGTGYVDVWVGPQAGVRLDDQGNGHFAGTIDLASLAPGATDVILAADSSDAAFAKISFMRSHPLYVLMTTDYDFSDPADSSLTVMDSLHRLHPALVMTHFASPYTFTDPAVTPERAGVIAAWWRHARDDFHDEIGLHIHPYCNFVEAAGVTCNTMPSVEFANGDTTGYTVEVASYSEADFLTLLHKADELFAANQLGKPITFRAGAWTASIETLRALAADGFVADTSALNWAKVEEWKNVGNKELWTWNMTHWAPIDDTSQPYYPNHDDILASSPPPLSILEVPDNGAMVDYVSTAEMTTILSHNWDGTSALAEPTQLTVGFHPSKNYVGDVQSRTDGILTAVDQHAYFYDSGPCVYAVLKDMPKAFPPSP